MNVTNFQKSFFLFLGELYTNCSITFRQGILELLRNSYIERKTN